MRISSQNSLSLIISLILTLIYAVSVALFAAQISNLPLFYLSILLFFLISFLLLNLIIANIIAKKIKPIYRTIGKFQDPDHRPNKGDLIREVNKDVENWVRDKSTEIDQLRANEKFRKEFIGSVSHELKTPIFNIQGYILTLLEGGLEDESINRLYLERTEKSINRMISIVKDLEFITMVETGELKLDIEAFDIIKLVQEIYEMQEIRAAKKNIKLEFAGKTDKSIMVKADKKRIFDVLNNLIVNSINYGKPNGKTSVDFLDMDDTLMIDVSDNGIGIPEKHHNRIFERFYRVDKGRSRDQGGTGLGLSIVKHFIEAHGQSIVLRSKPDVGTSFSFTLEKAR